jgi:hypothetical protein
VVVEGDGGGVVCMGVPVFPGVLAILGEFRAVMLWVKGVWGNGLRGGGVSVVLLGELVGLTVCVECSMSVC